MVRGWLLRERRAHQKRGYRIKTRGNTERFCSGQSNYGIDEGLRRAMLQRMLQLPHFLKVEEEEKEGKKRKRERERGRKRRRVSKEQKKNIKRGRRRKEESAQHVFERVGARRTREWVPLPPSLLLLLLLPSTQSILVSLYRYIIHDHRLCYLIKS